MFRYRLPDIVQQCYRGVTWRRNPAGKAVYLTFDDGCIPEVTPRVLDILDSFGVKATFFCVGDNVRKYPDLFAELKRRGHRVGNHTFHHLRGSRTSDAAYLADVQAAQELIGSNLFRPPHGRMKWSQKRRLQRDFEIIMWDVLTNDFDARLQPDEILRQTKRHTRNGSIVVFHDSLKAQRNMFAVLPEIIAWWQEQGYELKLL